MKLSDSVAHCYRKQDYSPKATISGVELIELKRFTDDGGAMTEIARLIQGQHQGVDGFEVRQINFSEIHEGSIKAFHVHFRQTDVWFIPPTDRVLVVLYDVRKGSPSEGVCQRIVMGAGNACLLRVPPGVAHGCKNLGPGCGHIIYFTDQHFDPNSDSGDEGRLPWDCVGEKIWELSKE